MTNNPLTTLPGAPPKFDLVGPTVDDDIHRIIMRYGAEAVKEAVKRQTKPKRGRKPEKDLPELAEVFEADARDWLNGGDPFASRSIYSIAKGFADRNPGHSHPATMKRIERKLVKRRVLITLATAEGRSRDGYPYATHIRALEALCNADSHPVWSSIRDRAKSSVADYEAKVGEAPPPHLSMKEVEEVARNAFLKLSDFAGPKPPRGILEILAPFPPKFGQQD